MKRFLSFVTFLLISATFCGCEGASSEEPKSPSTGESVSGTLTLFVNKPIIRAGIEEAVFTAILIDTEGNRHDVTNQTDIYLEGDDTPLTQPTFSTDEEGTYLFYAVAEFNVSPSVQVQSVAGIADLPTDPNPESFDFNHRMLLIQHTGTECPNCPTMMNLLKVLSEDEHYASCYYHVASHAYTPNYTTTDPAYTSAASLLSRTLNPGGSFPWLTFNLTEQYTHDLGEMKETIDELHQEVADAGIAASATRVGDHIYANIEVKAGKDGNYRIATWLLEDNISAVQDGATAAWQNTHNNCLREMAGDNNTNRIYGTTVPTAKQGEKIELITSLALEPKWKSENCKVLVIVTAKNSIGEYELANSAICPVGETVSYRYN